MPVIAFRAELCTLGYVSPACTPARSFAVYVCAALTVSKTCVSLLQVEPGEVMVIPQVRHPWPPGTQTCLDKAGTGTNRHALRDSGELAG